MRPSSASAAMWRLGAPPAWPRSPASWACAPHYCGACRPPVASSWPASSVAAISAAPPWTPVRSAPIACANSAAAARHPVRRHRLRRPVRAAPEVRGGCTGGRGRPVAAEPSPAARCVFWHPLAPSRHGVGGRRGACQYPPPAAVVRAPEARASALFPGGRLPAGRARPRFSRRAGPNCGQRLATTHQTSGGGWRPLNGVGAIADNGRRIRSQLEVAWR